jgi:peptidoglycan/xylan/chitin deacetylase (PgdA/CDA1 family)
MDYNAYMRKRLLLVIVVGVLLCVVGGNTMANYDLNTRALWPIISTADVGILILEYHCISTAPEGSKHPDLYIDQEVFKDQLMVLKNMGMKGVSFSDTLDEISKGSYDLSHVILTFDDGHDDNLQAVYEMHSLDFNATLYVITGKVGVKYPVQSLFYMGWDEIKKISDLGFEIGSHTVNHIDLSMASPSRVDYEIMHSIKDIEENLGIDVRSFSIPKGAYTTDVIVEISRYGLDGCVTSDRGLMTGQLVQKAPRIMVIDSTDVGKVVADYLATNLTFGEKIFISGDTGFKIRSFRSMLTRLGYPLKDTDVFDKQMESAVVDYQRILGLEPSGELNDTTIEIMINDFMELVSKNEN